MSRMIAVVVMAFSFVTGQAGTQPAASPSSIPSSIRSETLLQTGTAWDGTAYAAYPDGKPQLSMLRITIPARTTMEWHRHPAPNMAYVVSGEITVERQEGGARRQFVKGQVIAETVQALHRGVTGAQPVELIVFYAGASGLPLSELASKPSK